MTGWKSGSLWALLAGVGVAAGSATGATLLSDDFSQEGVGETINTLENWTHGGNLSNGTVVDQDPGAGVDQAVQLTQSAGGSGPQIYHDVDMATDGYTTLTIEFDLVEDAGDNWIGLFLTDDVANDSNNYRWQWNPGQSKNEFILEGHSGALDSSTDNLSGTHAMKFELVHDVVTKDNTLTAWVDSIQVLQVTDTDDVWAPSDQTRIKFFAFSGNTTSEIDNVNITAIPEPASLVLLGLGGLAMLSGRGEAASRN